MFSVLNADFKREGRNFAYQITVRTTQELNTVEEKDNFLKRVVESYKFWKGIDENLIPSNSNIIIKKIEDIGINKNVHIAYYGNE